MLGIRFKKPLSLVLLLWIRIWGLLMRYDTELVDVIQCVCYISQLLNILNSKGWLGVVRNGLFGST